MTPRAESVARGFDRLSRCYGPLTRLFPGDGIAASQRAFLRDVCGCSRALVIGGGSGRFVNDLLAAGFVGHVLNIDLSRGMLERTRRRLGRRAPQALSRVECRLGDVSSLRPSERFDLICTHCFLDLFEESRLRRVIDRLDESLAPDGLWWCSDFTPPAGGPVRRGAQRLTLSALYTFFRMTCSIDARRLPPIEDELGRLGYEVVQRREFSAGWLWSGLFRRGSAGSLAQRG